LLLSFTFHQLEKEADGMIDAFLLLKFTTLQNTAV
jgi:hypothetical protein